MIMEALLVLFSQIDGYRPGQMWFIPLLFIVMFVIMFFIFRRGGRGPFFSDKTRYMNNTNDKNSSAIDILKNRYAKGEISKEEYDRMKKDIS